ncbi:MAG TPA: hypothetical protein VMT16_12160 [Thermoanaerobaculia bacterium]|nr:hypothetical protein [Thermoanaerobaculia bacterium]
MTDLTLHRPAWVRWGLGPARQRSSALVLLIVALAVTFGCALAAEWAATGFFLAAALWTYLAIRWMDLQDAWVS